MDPKVIVVSKAVKQSIIRRVGIKKIRIIYNGLYKNRKKIK